MTMRSESDFETSFAISIGLVSQLVPERVEPSGMVTSIGSLAFAVDGFEPQVMSGVEARTLDFCIVLGLQLLEQLDTGLKELGLGQLLIKR